MTTPLDSWVLITGASSGFGEQLARQYAGDGYSLVLVARRMDGVRELRDELRQKYRVEVVAEQVDPSDVASAIQLHERLRERGISLGMMVNDAGHELHGPFLDDTLETALAMVRLDVASLIAVTQFLRKT